MTLAAPTTMRAVELTDPGGTDALTVTDRPVPLPRDRETLLQVKAFGLNRSELMTRQGMSPSVSLPRILGIEAVGVVVSCPSGAFTPGTAVATCMGGMGRAFDGSYAQYAIVPDGQLRAIETYLPWHVLGAIPEMFQTAWGSLTIGLGLEADQRLLVRGGTTSVGLAAIGLAARLGARVTATTRMSAKAHALVEAGASDVVIDDGALAEASPGYDAALDLIGTTTLADTMSAVGRGRVCMTGMAGGGWTLDRFAPIPDIPNGVCLTGYLGDTAEFLAMPLSQIVEMVASGHVHLPLGAVYTLERIAEAHRALEADEVIGKIVVVADPEDFPHERWIPQP